MAQTQSELRGKSRIKPEQYANGEEFDSAGLLDSWIAVFNRIGGAAETDVEFNMSRRFEFEQKEASKFGERRLDSAEFFQKSSNNTEIYIYIKNIWPASCSKFI